MVIPYDITPLVINALGGGYTYIDRNIYTY